MNSFHLTIGGKPVTAPSTFNVIDPADESVVAPCPEATIAIVDSAVASARQAFPAWSALPDADRVTKLNAIAALIEQHHPELSELVTREQGKTQCGPGADLELGGAVGWTRATASLQLPEETIQDDEAGRIHPNVAKLVFTGSIPTGRKVMESAARTLKRLIIELGGNDAGIILPGTNIEPLLEKLLWGCFINAGQTCAALKRLYVHEGLYEAVVSRFAEYCAQIPMGKGLDPKNLIGSVSNRMQLDKVSAYVDDATDDMKLVKEEQFGPAIPILKYRSVDEALQRANALEMGLGGSVWGEDPQEAARLARRLECGTAWVNQHGMPHPMAPFGGVKCSSIGVEFGVDGLKEYTTVQVLNIAL